MRAPWLGRCSSLFDSFSSSARSVMAEAYRLRGSPGSHAGAASRMRPVGTDQLVIHGAREHNLKNITLELPRDRLIVFTGLSGSGKSLARVRHDLRGGPAPLRRVAVRVRAAVPRADGEARRRLHRGPLAGHLDRPEVDRRRNPRSTVGTITEIYDYLRLLFARDRHPALPDVRTPIGAPDTRADRRPGHAARPRARGSRCWRRSSAAARASTRSSWETWRARASRALGSTARSATSPRRSGSTATYKHTIEVVVDRLVAKPDIRRRSPTRSRPP